MMSLSESQAIARKVAGVFVNYDVVRFNLNEPVTFKSGLLSPMYIEGRSIAYHPRAWRTVIDGLVSVLYESEVPYSVIAGIAMGGVPHSAVLAYETMRPHVYVRPEAKQHGTRRLIEGGEVLGKRTLPIEDTVTTGESSLAAIAILRAAEAEVSHCLAITSYNLSAGQAAFAEAQISLLSLTSVPEIVSVAYEQGALTLEERQSVDAWLADPVAWGAQYNSRD
jgi:orotate phosphoribosyltransferase